MRVYSLIIFIALALFHQQVWAKEDEKDKNPRILILLDGSSSMLHEWTKDNIRFEAAAKIVDKLMDSVYAVNKDVEFALRVYGHQFPTVKNNCYDTKLEVMFSRDNYTQMMLRLADLHPLGISPIAYSIEQAAIEDMENLADNKYSLILITDGGESCEGDICKVVEHMLRKKINFKPYILSLLDYAPLRAQYNCMGEYLLVTKPEDIDPVVGKIVESYRHSFIQPVTVAKLIETARKAPSVLKVTTPEVKITMPDPKPEPKKEEVAIQKQQPVIPKPVPTPKPEVPKPEPTPVPKPSKIVVEDILHKKKQDVITLSVTRQRILPQMYFTRAFAVVTVPKLKMPVIEAEPPKPKEPVYTPMATAPAAKAPVTALAQPKPQMAEYSVKRQEAKETSLQIFFTNGKGKYYQTAPEVVLRDMKTNEPVVKFNRTVDAYGQPHPQKNIPPGTYNMTITGKDGYVAPNIEVRANNNNEVNVTVAFGSISFSYIGSPYRPVKEFTARVNVAFKRSAVNVQECTAIVTYEPDNYHIEISTNPISVRNVDLDFGVTVNLQLAEPGQIKVLNPKGYAQVEFLYQYGEYYETFKPINVTGNNRQQEFLIQPGRYKVAYIQDALAPNPKPITKAFVIKSNTLTELTLD